MSKSQKNKSVYLEEIKVSDNDFFNDERLDEWKRFIALRAKIICEELKNKVDVVCGVDYFVSYTLIKEVIRDAVVGMRKIIYRTPHDVEHPNAFKIAAYLSYWFMRHKPVSIYYPEETDLDFLKLKSEKDALSKEELSWKLKHINEVIAVDIVTSYLFDFEKVVCDERQCKFVTAANTIKVENSETHKKVNKKLFDFKNFDELRALMINKLTYYFAYRAIAPKIIEHILEGYAFHPAWGLTGAHWETKE